MGHEQIRANVRKFREARTWSHDDLGKKAGYTNGTMIRQIERGIKEPSAEKIDAIAQALGVSVSDLYGDQTRGLVVTNHANGNRVVYQHVEGPMLMTDEFQVMLRQVVTEEVDARCTRLVEEMWSLVAEAMRAGGAPGAVPPVPMGQGEG